MKNFFEQSYANLQQDNKSYIQENSLLKDQLFKLKEKINKKTVLIKNLKENEAALIKSFSEKLKEKDEQIEKLMKVIGVLPEVYLEKVEEARKIPKSFHNVEKNLDREKKMLREMFDNMVMEEKQKKTEKNTIVSQKNNVKNPMFRQKKLSWFFLKFINYFSKATFFFYKSDVNAKFELITFDPQTTKNHEKMKENGIFSN